MRSDNDEGIASARTRAGASEGPGRPLDAPGTAPVARGTIVPRRVPGIWLAIGAGVLAVALLGASAVRAQPTGPQAAPGAGVFQALQVQVIGAVVPAQGYDTQTSKGVSSGNCPSGKVAVGGGAVPEAAPGQQVQPGTLSLQMSGPVGGNPPTFGANPPVSWWGRANSSNPGVQWRLMVFAVCA